MCKKKLQYYFNNAKCCLKENINLSNVMTVYKLRFKFKNQIYIKLTILANTYSS